MDLNLLIALDALLRDASVAKAAERLRLSAPAMSRTLARIRSATGDPILVRAGRRLVPTPRALAMRERVRAAVEEASALLTPAEQAAPSAYARTFSLRADDAFAATVGAELITRMARDAPGIVLRFVPEGDEDVAALRDGSVDIDVGVQGALGPEVRVRKLVEQTHVVIARRGHPALRGRFNAERFARAEHVVASRRGRAHGPIDAALAAQGLKRTVRSIVASHLAAAHVVAHSAALGLVPQLFATRIAVQLPVATVRWSVPTPSVNIAMAWHPRFDADPAHAFLRNCIADLLTVQTRESGKRVARRPL